MDANESAASLPQAEGESSDGRMFIGNWEHDESETHSQHLEDKVAGDEYRGLDDSMDITTVNEQGVQWDFTNVEMRNQAFKKIVAEKPFLLTGAHPCANWRSKSNASWSRMTPREKADELHRARVHMQFVCRMYKLQHEEGRYFLHEHSQSELPSRKDCVEEIQEMTGAKLMSVSQGSCSLPSIRRERNVELNEKSTMMVTNCPAIAFTLRVSAEARFLNKRYPEHLERNEHKSIEDLREDISCGIQLQHKWSRQHKNLLASVDVKNPHANFGDVENSVPPEESNDDLLDQAWDGHAGESLDAKKVKEARRLEMEYYDKMHVFDKVLVAQCWERTGKAPLKARLVDIDRGTRCRSRWVAKQFRGSDSEEWFAATPPIEALRALISHTMSGTKKKALMVCDVSRAFFYAPVQQDNNMCVQLRMCMYGTKAAAQNWQKKVQDPFCSVIPREVSNVLCTETTSLCQENQWILFGCETSCGLSWKSTLQYLETNQECRER